MRVKLITKEHDIVDMIEGIDHLPQAIMSDHGLFVANPSMKFNAANLTEDCGIYTEYFVEADLEYMRSVDQ